MNRNSPTQSPIIPSPARSPIIPSPAASPATPRSATSSPMMQQSARLLSATASPEMQSARSATSSRAPSSARSASSPVISKSERKKLLQAKIKTNLKLKSNIADIENTKKVVKQEIAKIKRQQTPAGVLRNFINTTFYKIPASINDLSSDINKLEQEKIEYNAVLINVLNAKKILDIDIVKQAAKEDFIDTSMAAIKIDKKVAENKNVLKMVLNDINGIEKNIIKIDRKIQELKQLKEKELKIVMDKNALEAQIKQEEQKRLKELKDIEKRQKNELNAELKLQKANISAKEKEEILKEKEVYAKQLSQYLSGFKGSNEIIIKINQYKGLYEDALKDRQANTVGITGRFFKTKDIQNEMNYKYDIANINSKAYYANMKLFEKLFNDKQNFIRNHYAKIMNQSSVEKMKETQRLLKIKDDELISNLYIIPSGFAPKEAINEAKRINDLKKNEEKEKQRQAQEKIANELLMQKAKNDEKDARLKSREVNERLLSAEINKREVIYDKVNQQRASLTEAESLKLREQASRPIEWGSSSSAKTSRRNIQEIIAPSMTMSAADAERERKRLIRQEQEEKDKDKIQKEIIDNESKFLNSLFARAKPATPTIEADVRQRQRKAKGMDR
jgi:hypothetical protein